MLCWHSGWTTEGDSAFNELSGSSPLSIRQQALRGIAKVALARGDKQGARHQYERILGKALIGQGAPAAHWAHSEYAWLLFEDGNLEVSSHCSTDEMRQAVLQSIVNAQSHPQLFPISDSLLGCAVPCYAVFCHALPTCLLRSISGIHVCPQYNTVTGYCLRVTFQSSVLVQHSFHMMPLPALQRFTVLCRCSTTRHVTICRCITLPIPHHHFTVLQVLMACHVCCAAGQAAAGDSSAQRPA